MADREPLTIEVLAVPQGGQAAVLDCVIGGTVYLDEAKRIGHHLLSITEGKDRPEGFRIVDSTDQVLYVWHAENNGPTTD